MEHRREIKPSIVCLCGSTRFIECFAIVSWELEQAGYIVLGCHYMPPGYPSDHLAEHAGEGVKQRMDRLHFRKIEMADYIVVLNVNGYIGWSTRNEIKYAEKLGKPIYYLEP